MPYFFGGQSGIKTPQEAKRLRDIADALAGHPRAPHTIGEGLSAIGDAIAQRRASTRADRIESEGRAAYQEKYGDLLKSFLSGGGGTAPAVPDAPETPGGVIPQPPDMSQAGVGSDYAATTNIATSQLPPPEDLAAMVRTVYGEAGNQSPEGQRAVAEVILNRSRETGMTPQQVVMAKGQFEPWQKRAAELNAIDPNSQQYQSVLGNITSAFGPDDPTGGADHFYSPGAQAALGRDTPDWAQGQQGRDIGDQRFFSLGYGGDAGTSGAQDATAAQSAGQPDQMAGLSIDVEPGGQQAPPQQPGIQQVADSGSGFDPRMIDALNDPWIPEGTKAVLEELFKQQLKQAAPDYQITTEGGDFFQVSPKKGTARKILDLPDAPEKPDPEIRRFEYARDNGFTGSFEEWQKLKKPMVEVNTGNLDAGETKLTEKMAEKEAERWDAMVAAGDVAGGTKQSLLMLDELIKIAPQGPITGRLAEMFPGFTSAGAAFNSITKSIAPTLRTPGSGSTSDIEYEGMLNSLARLSNNPDANALINEMMKAKADINIERADIITAKANGDIDSKTARKQLREINKRSIMSPKLRSMLDNLGDEEDTDSLSDEELLKRAGGG